MTPLWVAQVSTNANSNLQARNLSNSLLPNNEQPEDVMALLNLAQDLHLYYVPFVISSGIALNFFCCFGFSRTKLCKKFFTPLFTAICVANLGFLLTLLLIWLKDQGVDMYVAPGMCPVVIFLSHFFPFLSFWTSMTTIVILVLQPAVHAVNKFARGAGRGKILAICLSVFAFTVYLYKTWTYGVLTINNVRYCTVLPETQKAMRTLNMFDVFFLLLLPFVGFAVFDVIVFVKCVRVAGGRGESSVTSRHRASKDALRVVIAQSICFILFVGPGCLSKIYFYLKGDGQHFKIRHMLLQNLFQYSFYTYFAIIPAVHIITSRSFRTHVKNSICGVKGSANGHVVHIVQVDPPSNQTLL